MLGVIKSLPLIGLLGVAAYGYHYVTVTKLESEIASFRYDLAECNNVKNILESADTVHKETITKLQRDLEAQRVIVAELNTNVSEIRLERDRYLSIFKRHDLTKLAIRKPGLIEPRINKGTKSVFETIERDTRHTNEDSININSNSPDDGMQ